jgi:hypothetical protein
MSLTMKKFTNIFGVQKPISVSQGAEKVFLALGASPDQLKAMSDEQPLIVYKDLGNGRIRIYSTSKVDQFDITFKMDEECEAEYFGRKYKVLS